MPRRHLVTSGLPYSNGRLHVGHIAGAYLPADIHVRYLRATGADVKFVCGTDDNGAAIEIAAKKQGVQPAEVNAKYHASQKASFDGLGISFDVFGGTHHPDFVATHERLSQEFFTRIHDQGYFTKKTAKQLYDADAGQFLPDRYVKGTCHYCGAEGQNGDQCEACGKTLDPLLLGDPVSVLTGAKPEVRETTHWYLKLAAVEGPLKAWLESKADWRPQVRNFALGQVADGLPERAMTRDLTWGVPVPLDDPDAAGKVLYVWFDAPIGYVSFTEKLLADSGGGELADWWKSDDCNIVHFIGEDNVVFHALIWPAMLMAEGTYRLPHAVVANSFLNIQFPGQDEEKISKSRGTAVWIEDYLAEHDPDPLRYYLTAIAPETARTTYSPEEFVQRNDSELLAALGNFVNRNLTFTHKHFDGRVPEVGSRDEIDDAMLARRQTQADAVAAHLEAFRFRDALAELMTLARDGNKYLDEKKPWIQRKTDMAVCGTTLNVCLQVIRTLATLMEPFLPYSAAKLRKMLAIGDAGVNWAKTADQLPDCINWAKAAEELPAGHELGEVVMLVRKLGDDK